MRGHYGRGTIRQRKDGRWEGMISAGSIDGRRLRKSVFGKTKQQVIRRLDAERKDDVSKAANLTLTAYLQKWMRDWVVPNRRPWTTVGYRKSANYLAPKIGHVRLAKLKPDVIQRALNEIRTEVGASTAWHCRKDLHAALNVAVRWRLMQDNPVRFTERIAVADREPTWYGRDELALFIGALAGHRLRPLFILSLATGLRPSEVLALEWQDIDLDRGFLKVRRSLEPGGVGSTKSHRSRRPIPLNSLAVEALTGMSTLRRGLVFHTKNGTPFSLRNVERSFKQVLQRAQLPDIRWYDLRHSFASLLAEDVPVKTLQELLGHARPEVSLRYYIHTSDEAKRRAVGLVDGILTTNLTTNLHVVH